MPKKLKYGPHEWSNPDGRTGECVHGCGCSMTGHRGKGPIDINPFGECRNNPKLTLKAAKEQIHQLIKRAETAEAKLARAQAVFLELQRELQVVKTALGEIDTVVKTTGR